MKWSPWPSLSMKPKAASSPLPSIKELPPAFLPPPISIKRVKFPIIEITLSAQDHSPLPQIQQLPATERYCVFITRLEEALPDVAGTLNLQREIFAELPHAVIFWVTEYGLRQLALLAPDFWAWRSGVFDLRQAAETIASAISTLWTAPPEFPRPSPSEKRILLYQDLLQEYQQQTPPDNRFSETCTTN